MSAGTRTCSAWAVLFDATAEARSSGTSAVPRGASPGASVPGKNSSGPVRSYVAAYSTVSPSSVGASSCTPRRRLSGVNRQISSRPAGTGWSDRSNDATGWRWDWTVPLGTLSTAPATFSVAGS